MRDTCAPPPEHARHEWHWLQREEQWLVVRWLAEPGKLDPWVCADLTGEQLHALGWRYVGQARPPTEGEG